MMVKRRRWGRRRVRFSSPGVLVGLVFFLLVSFLLLYLLYQWKGEVEEEVRETAEVTEVVSRRVQACLNLYEVETKIAEIEAEIETEIEVEVEAEEPLLEIKEEIAAREKEEEPVALPPRIAIIIDDLGYSMRAVMPIFDIEYPLTLSILPGLRYSLLLARRMSRPPFEAILHLPLEPEAEEHLERGTIMVAMSEEEVRDLMEKHLEPLLPYIRGVNSHMGSKATADEELMSIVLEEVKKRGLYFIDSYTTEKSVVLEVARGLGLRAASRQVFLDSGEERNDPDYIRGQMKELAELARKEGQALGIGHPTLPTLKVLQEMMPKLAGEGIQFVTASEMVE